MSDYLDLYYGLDDEPISREGYLEILTRNHEARRGNPESSPSDDPTRVGSDQLPGDVFVSTVWLGINHNHGSGPPLLYETMIFGGAHDQWQDRYSTRELARLGHERVVAALKAGKEPPCE